VKAGSLRRALAASALLGAIALVALALHPRLALDAEFARQRWWAGAIEQARMAAGHRIVHLEAGQGPTMVLLHGFTGSKENWLPLMRRLAPRWRVLAPDLPGWGDSSRQPDADYGYSAQVERLAAWLPTVADGPVVLVGHSMGGGIAALLAARHPDQVSQLVLMDAGGVRYRDNEFGQAVLAGENPFAVRDRASLARYLGTVFDAPPWVPWPADRALIARRIVDAPFEGRVLDAIGRGPEAFLPGREAARITQPTLLLWCRADRVIDVSAAAIYRDAIRGSQVRLLQGCNHMPMMERPDETVAALEDFLP
jgi:abhydrolase domain-containing protein 6